MPVYLFFICSWDSMKRPTLPPSLTVSNHNTFHVIKNYLSQKAKLPRFCTPGFEKDLSPFLFINKSKLEKNGYLNYTWIIHDKKLSSGLNYNEIWICTTDMAFNNVLPPIKPLFRFLSVSLKCNPQFVVEVRYRAHQRTDRK